MQIDYNVALLDSTDLTDATAVVQALRDRESADGKHDLAGFWNAVLSSLADERARREAEAGEIERMMQLGDAPESEGEASWEAE